MTLPGLDTAAITRWLTDRVDDLRAPLTFDVISGGHSNITTVITDADGRRVVLRRPPLGKLPDGAHDVLREYRIVRSLATSPVPVPEAVAACDDPAITGAPFAVTRWVDGFVIATTAAADSILATSESRTRAGAELVGVLADLHRVDVAAAGLGDRSRRHDQPWVLRQLDRYQQLWRQTATRELPAIDAVAERLWRACPADDRRCVVHSDYRLGNVMVTRSGSVAAVLDWELASVGHPLADLGFLLANWHEPGDSLGDLWMTPPPTLAGGFPRRRELVDRYSAATGWDVDDVPYFRAFAYWRVAVIAEGIKRRYESRSMASTHSDAAHLSRRVVDLVAASNRALDER